MIQAKYNPSTGQTETKASEILFPEQLELELIGVILYAYDHGHNLADLVSLACLVWESEDELKEGNLIEALDKYDSKHSPQPYEGEQRSSDRRGIYKKTFMS